MILEYLLERLATIPGLSLYRAPGGGARQAGVLSFNIEGFRAREVGAILDHQFDIAVRAGHHCAALIHNHLQDESFDGTVLVSVSIFTTKEDVTALVNALKALDRKMLRKIPASLLRKNC